MNRIVLAKILSYLTLIISLISLGSWFASEQILLQFNKPIVPVALSSAFCFCFIAIVFLFSETIKKTKKKRNFVISLASIFIGFIFFILFHSFSILSIDIEFFFLYFLKDKPIYPNGRMSPITCILFVFVFINLIISFLQKKNKFLNSWSNYSNIIIFTISGIFVLGYFYGSPLLYEGKIIPIALVSSVCIVFISIVSILKSDADSIPLKYFFSNKIEFLLFRYFLPVFIFILLLLGWLETNEIFQKTNKAIGFSLYIIFFCIIVSLFIFRISKILSKRIDALNNENSRLMNDIIEKNKALKEHITERKLIETELSRFFELVPDMICIATTNGNFIRLNKAWENVLGFNVDELLHKKITDLIHPDDIENTYKEIEKQLNNQFTNCFVNRYLCKSGAYKWLEWVAIPSPDGKHLYAVARDITEKKIIETELIKAKDKAEESDRLKSSFLQNMSHEIRTPLNAISGFSRLITMPDLPEEKKLRFSNMITASSQKLIDIITDVIEISQIQAKLVTIKIKEFNFNPFFNDIVQPYYLKAKDKNIQLIASCDKKIQTISSDSEKLNRIIIHLIDNALKFTVNGEVLVICSEESDLLKIEVNDSGIGISEEMQKIIFEPFRQVEMGITRNFGGNGLGLAIVKAYTDLLNGSVELQSEINKGSIFRLKIPIRQEKNIASLQKKDIERKQIKTVLIAEDEFSNFQYLKELLEEYDFEILYAENGRAALDACRNNSSIDLILMDIKMPIMDGYTATKLIKEFRKDLPIMAQTAYALEIEVEKYGDIFDDYIVKPIDEKTLKEKIEKLDLM